MEADIRVMWQKNKEHLVNPEAERGKEQILPWNFWKEVDHVDILVLYIWLLQIWECKFMLYYDTKCVVIYYSSHKKITTELLPKVLQTMPNSVITLQTFYKMFICVYILDLLGYNWYTKTV